MFPTLNQTHMVRSARYNTLEQMMLLATYFSAAATTPLTDAVEASTGGPTQHGIFLALHPS